MNEQPNAERFCFTSDDDERRTLVLTIEYNTFLALGFDGYDSEDLRAFIRQSIQEGNISVSHP